MNKLLLTSFFFSLSLFAWPAAHVEAADIQVQIDGQIVDLKPAPLYKDGRTLVPLRPLFEAMNAEVIWQDGSGIVTVKKGDRFIRFTVGERFACVDETCAVGALMDVPSQLINYKTYVPIRFVSTALGAKVDWDGSIPMVIVDTTQLTSFPVQITGVPSVWSEKSDVVVSSSMSNLSRVRIFLLDKKAFKGPVLAAGTDTNGSYMITPDPALNGEWYMVAAADEEEGRKYYSPVLPVTVAVKPAPILSGVTAGQVLSGDVALSVPHNYVAAYVEFKLVDPSDDSSVILGQTDPDKPYTYHPQVEQNGEREIVATVYDRSGKAYAASPVPVYIQVEPVMSVPTLPTSISTYASFKLVANFHIQKIEIKLDDTVVLTAGQSGPVVLPNHSAVEQAFVGYTPHPDQNGAHRLTVLAYDKAGKVYPSDTVSAAIDTAAYVSLNVGPDQVISAATDLRLRSNIEITHFEIYLNDLSNGTSQTIVQADDSSIAYSWTPPAATNGKFSLECMANDSAGKVLNCEVIPIKIVTTKTFGATPLGPKEEFRAKIEPLAIDVFERTNMSASIQVAQAILESGWGQYLPTDKYSGLVSYNLFGIKGTGPAGSVTSSTSEVYGGLRYRIEAAFRAYTDISQSWEDHANLLLLKSWYQPFRDVMFDPVQGAWGLYRSGYATAPDYAIKLIQLQQQQKLWQLDWLMP